MASRRGEKLQPLLIAAAALAWILATGASVPLPSPPAWLVALAAAAGAAVIAARLRGFVETCVRVYSARPAPPAWVVKDSARVAAALRLISRARGVAEARLEISRGAGLLCFRHARWVDPDSLVETVLAHTRVFYAERRRRPGCLSRLFASVEQVAEIAERIIDPDTAVIDFKSYLEGSQAASRAKLYLGLGGLVSIREKEDRAAAAASRLSRLAAKRLVLVDPVDIDIERVLENAPEDLECVVLRYAGDMLLDRGRVKKTY